jgi:hypothetical protein
MAAFIIGIPFHSFAGFPDGVGKSERLGVLVGVIRVFVGLGVEVEVVVIVGDDVGLVVGVRVFVGFIEIVLQEITETMNNELIVTRIMIFILTPPVGDLITPIYTFYQVLS